MEITELLALNLQVQKEQQRLEQIKATIVKNQQKIERDYQRIKSRIDKIDKLLNE